ncbi:MAG TPA: PAS domain-containing protein, partial [Leptolyngbyaceae cyanobacterium M65_K2018_010]|nr:PAS domain-containing protein [Leptolyngbyaceae cyanobacterium M65_K2018_010]
MPRLPLLHRLRRWSQTLSLRTLLLVILALQLLGVIGLLSVWGVYPGFWQLALISLLALIVSWVGGLIVVDHILKPLKMLQLAVQGMAQGQWQTPLTVGRFGELRELALAFNTMAAQLGRSFAELEHLNQALKQSERRWRDFLDVIPLGIVVYYRQGKMVFASAEARQLLRLEDMPSVPGLGLAEAFPAYRGDGVALYPVQELPLARSLRGQKGWADDIVLRRVDQEIPIEMVSTPFFDRSGQVEFAIAAFQDITPRKQAQRVLADYNQTLEATVAQRTAALHRVQSTQRLILEAIPDLLLRYNRQGICLDVMSSGSVTLIAPAQVQIGQPMSVVLPPDRVAERMHYIRLALDTGQPQVYEYKFETAKGWQHEEARVVVSGDNEVLVMVRDITERKLAELSRQESQMLYRSLTEVLPQGLYRIDRQGRLTFANPAYLALLDQPLEDCLGKTAWELFPQPMAQRWAQEDEQVMATGQPLNQVETYDPGPPKGPIYLQVIKSPILSAEGEIAGMQGVFWDVTELKRTEAALASQKQ